MKYIYSLLLTFSLVGVFAQSADKRKLNLYIGSGANYNSLVTNLDPEAKGQSLAIQNRFAISYNTHKQVSLGVELMNNRFITDDSARIKTVTSGMLGLSLSYSFLNREKSQAYIGATVGGFNFTFNVIDSLNNTGSLLGHGVYNKLFIGYNKYFGKVFGFYIQGGLMNMPIQMDKLTVNDQQKEYFDKKLVTDWKVLMRGGYVNLGLTIKI